MTVPVVLGNREEVDAALRLHRRAGRPVALVPTMGALHEGHARLLEVAAELAPVTVVSIFVNPLQFGPSEDFERYPRTLDADVELCARHGVDVVLAPTVAQMYPDGAPQVTVDPGPLGAELEGALRPGHFTGVLTVVAKLFNLVVPDVAVFGEKDYQQLVLVRRMVADLSLGVDVVGVPTVREPDGLALSSRNRYLSPDERAAAAQLSAALRAGAAAGRDGAGARDGAAAAEEAARAALSDVPALVPDYVAARGPELGPPASVGEGRLLVAVRAGGTRLIDNTALSFGAPSFDERP